MNSMITAHSCLLHKNSDNTEGQVLMQTGSVQIYQSDTRPSGRPATCGLCLGASLDVLSRDICRRGLGYSANDLAEG